MNRDKIRGIIVFIRKYTVVCTCLNCPITYSTVSVLVTVKGYPTLLSFSSLLYCVTLVTISKSNNVKVLTVVCYVASHNPSSLYGGRYSSLSALYNNVSICKTLANMSAIKVEKMSWQDINLCSNFGVQNIAVWKQHFLSRTILCTKMLYILVLTVSAN